MNRKVFYFVRHGQSEGNAGGVRQGSDSPLTLKGLLEARAIAQRLSSVPIDTVISSTHVRAKETAEAIQQQTSAQLQYSSLFVERGSPSRTHCLPNASSEAQNILEVLEESYGNLAFRCEDAETSGEVLARVDAALHFLEIQPASCSVVITHSWFLRFLGARILLGDSAEGNVLVRCLKALKVNNTGISVIECKRLSDATSQWRIHTWNDYSHLAAHVE